MSAAALLQARRLAAHRPEAARRLAAKVAEQARASGQRLLEAQALLCHGHGLARCTDPAATWRALLHAERIFRGHGCGAQAAQCLVGAARALYFAGRERRARAFVRAALQDAELPAWDRALAHALLFEIHGRLGLLVEAYGHLDERALPLARACGEPRLLAHLLGAKAWLFARLLHTRQNGSLPLPALADVPALDPTLLDWKQVRRLFDEARRLLPAEALPTDLLIDQEYALGLMRGEGGAHQAARRLMQLALRVTDDDPPAAAWAHLCRAMVLHDAGDPAGALAALPPALVLAERCRLVAMRRDLQYFESVCLEATGRTAEAYAALKQYMALMLRDSGIDADEIGEPAADPPHHLRGIEPASVRRAVRWIEQHLGQPLSAEGVAQACGVSRRTLDGAFQAARSTTLSAYLRDQQFAFAAEQLLHTPQTVRDIARAIGYRSPTMFSREFRRRLGLTPTQWRGIAGGD